MRELENNIYKSKTKGKQSAISVIMPVYIEQKMYTYKVWKRTKWPLSTGIKQTNSN
jgi:hypothetical protein